MGGCKADAVFRPGRGFDQFTDGVKHDFNLSVMTLIFPFQLIKLLENLLMSGEKLTELHEGPHNHNIDLDSSIAVEDRREHGHTLFRKGIRQRAPPPSSLF